MVDDISAVAERLGARLKRLGNERVGPCPKCGGRDRFSVNTKSKSSTAAAAASAATRLSLYGMSSIAASPTRSICRR